MKWNWKKILLGLVFADFVIFTGYVVYQYGYIGFFKIAANHSVSIQLFLDLIIALVFVTGFMIRDARKRGINVAPYIALTLVAGSIGPMLYYLLRKEPETNAEALAPNAVKGAATAT